MAFVNEVEVYDEGVYQYELTDPVRGGADGVDNYPIKNLANRTKYLKAQIDANNTNLPVIYATKSGVQGAVYSHATASGTANAITAIFTPAITALVDGMTLFVVATSANTSATPTFSANGLPAKTIVKGTGSALLSGDIAGAGHILELKYKSSTSQWVLQNPSIAPFIANYALVTDSATKSGVQGCIYSSASAGGTVNAITAIFTPAITALVDGMSVTVTAIGANTVVAPTFSPNGLTAYPIVKGLNSQLAVGDIFGAGYRMKLIWCAAYNSWVLMNPANSVGLAQTTLLQVITTNLYIKPNASAPNSKIDISAQEAILIAGTNVIKPTNINITLDMTVNGLNGLDTGIKAINSWYTIYLISNGITTAAIASLSTIAPTLPAGYSFQGYISVIRINSSGNIAHFAQRQNIVEYTETSVLSAGQASTSGVFQGLSIATAVPPQAKRVKCRLSSSIAGNGVLKVAANAAGDGVAGGNISTANLYETVQVLITDQQLLYWTQNSNTAGAVCIINVCGFEV